MMKATILSIALTIGMYATVPAYSQTATQDVKNAGHDTKTATAKGYNKSTSGVKKGYKKSTHATKTSVNKGANKVAGKTSTS